MFQTRFVDKYCKVEVKSLSRVRLFVTPWTVSYLAPPSMGFSRQEYSSGLPFPSPGHLPNPGIRPRSPSLRADSLPSEPQGSSVNCVDHIELVMLGFWRQEHSSGLPFPSPGDLADSRIQLASPGSPALTGRFFTTETPRKPPSIHIHNGINFLQHKDMFIPPYETPQNN